ncbi:MAG: hypothetical protein HY860_03375, partial [Chlamydiales bacterium]|nr:hypothetical protein [Chlamydiales bacterium]
PSSRFGEYIFDRKRNFLYCLCEREIDIIKASLDKIEKNNKKYPSDQFQNTHPRKG